MAGRSSGRSPGLSTSSLRDVGPILAVVVLSVVVLAGLAVLPAKTWFSQRDKMQAAEAELSQIEAETAELQRVYERLGTDEEVELRARRDFDLVFPGEESYRIVPVEP